MFDIHEISAAPHFPQALKSNLAAAWPESPLAHFLRASEVESGIEARMREGEIFVALTAS